MAEADHAAARENPDVAHERSDVNHRAIAGFALGLLVLAIVIHIGLYWLLEYYRAREARRAAAVAVAAPSAEREIPPPPRLQVSPQADMAELRAAEEKLLYSYGWVDRERKVARIPIDRAMELLAQKGLPARKAPGAEAGRQASQKSAEKRGEQTK